MLISLLVLTLLTILFVKIHLHKSRLLKNIRHLPASNGLPIIGVGHHFFGKSTTGIYKGLIELSEAHENPSLFWFGTTLVIVISSAEDMQTVLTSPHCLQKAYVYDLMADNDGIFKSKAHIWKQHRKLLNPTFNHKILLSFIPIFNEKAKIMAHNLERLLNQEDPFDISKQFFACTLDAVCATSLGAHFDFQNDKNNDVLESMEKYIRIIGIHDRYTEVAAERVMKVWLHWDFIYKWSKLYKIQTELTEKIYTLPREILRIKEKDFSMAQSDANVEEQDEFKEPQIFVNELLRMKAKGLIDDKMLFDQIVTMIAGGNETTALTSSHVILMLAMFPDIQERVFREIKSAHSSQYSDTDAETMTKLPYLEMVIRETMRVLPVGPFLARETLEEVKISKCTIPKGAMLMLAFHVLHRDKSVWGPHPEKFNPDHFLPEKVATRHPYAYLPFSGGPRNCIGIKYGWMSMKVMISALVRRYKFTTEIKFEDLTPKWDVTLKITNRHLVRIEPRLY